MTRATIKTITTDEKLPNVTWVGVDVEHNGKQWHESFRVINTDHVPFTEFREKLIEAIMGKIKQDTDKDDNIKELVKHKGIPFDIELPKAKSNTKIEGGE